jgi:hypothetical protein
MATDLVFPRLIYRGPEDPIGEGRTETKECADAGVWDTDRKAGWRLERDPKHHAETAKAAAADDKADAAESKAKK